MSGDFVGPALEGRWDCPNCFHKSIRARHDECPKCFAAKPGNVQYYLTEDANELSEAELEAMGGDAVEWTCGACGATNNADLTHCKECNTPKGTIEVTDETFTFVGYGEGTTGSRASSATYGHDQSRNSYGGRNYSSGNYSGSSRTSSRSFSQSNGNPLLDRLGLIAKFGGALFVVLVLLGIIRHFTTPFQVSATVREPELVRLQPLEREDPVWRTTFNGQYSAGAFNIQPREWLDTGRDEPEQYQGTCTRQVDSGRRTPTRTVPGRQVHVGNGVYRTTAPTTTGGDIIYEDQDYSCTKTRYVDVYAWGNRYQVMQWSFSRTLREPGTRSNPPMWPSAADARTNERFSLNTSRSEVYRLIFDDPETPKTWERSENSSFNWWRDVEQGQTCLLTVNRLGGLVEINSCE